MPGSTWSISEHPRKKPSATVGGAASRRRRPRRPRRRRRRRTTARGRGARAVMSGPIIDAVVVAGTDDDVGDARRDRLDQRIGDRARPRRRPRSPCSAPRPSRTPAEMAASAAASTSASGSTTMWFLAPPSACTRLPCARAGLVDVAGDRGAARRTTPRRRRGASSSASTASASPCTTLSTPSGNPASLHQLGEQQRRRRVLLRRLEHERVAARDRVGEHPQRHHHREVERRDAGDDADRLQHGVHVDAGRDLGAVRALQQVRDAARELDALEATGDLAPGVVEHLAVLAGDQRGEVVAVRRRSARAGGTSPRARRLQRRSRPTRAAASTATFTASSTSAADASATSAVCTPRAGSKTGAAPRRVAVDPRVRRSSVRWCPRGARRPTRGGRAYGRSRRRSSSASRPAASPSCPSTDCERVRVEARRVREVGLEQDAVLADRVDEVGQLVAVVLEPERGVHVAPEVLRRHLLQLAPARRARSPTSRSRASRG